MSCGLCFPGHLPWFLLVTGSWFLLWLLCWEGKTLGLVGRSCDPPWAS